MSIKLKWDVYSDQPEAVIDKSIKRQIYKQGGIWDFLKTVLVNLFVFPLVLLRFWLIPIERKKSDTNRFFGMSINLDKNPNETRALIDELGVNNLLIRIPLSDIQNLDKYIQFAQGYQDKKLLFNILQDREHVDDLALLKRDLEEVFSRLLPLSCRFQVGNAVNRKKWAFFSMDEYLSFYQVAYQLKQEKFPKLKLLGSSVIDFEYYFTIRTLFNFYRLSYDQCSSLLYVDRRGAPENTQMGLSLQGKLQLLYHMLKLSPKVSPEIVVTETNWPITQTHPYAPTSEADCVSLEDHADFLVRYYLLALASGVVVNVYWHQLIAPGYGLVDNREKELIKYPAFEAMKTMVSHLQGADFVGMQVSDFCCCEFLKGDETIRVLWSLRETEIKIRDEKVICRNGDVSNTSDLLLGGSPVYLISKK